MVFDRALPVSPSSSRSKLDGLSPPVVVKEKSCGSSGCVSRLSVMLPRLRLVNVQVTTSPTSRVTFDGDDPSEHVAVASHPGWGASDTEYPGPGVRFVNVRELASALESSPSSSSWKLVGLRPPPVVNEKSCGSSGWA